MQVACLYDVHGNLPALRAVLADPAFAGATHVLVGGDAVAGPNPRRDARAAARARPAGAVRPRQRRPRAGAVGRRAAGRGALAATVQRLAGDGVARRAGARRRLLLPRLAALRHRDHHRGIAGGAAAADAGRGRRADGRLRPHSRPVRSLGRPAGASSTPAASGCPTRARPAPPSGACWGRTSSIAGRRTTRPCSGCAGGIGIPRSGLVRSGECGGGDGALRGDGRGLNGRAAGLTVTLVTLPPSSTRRPSVSNSDRAAEVRCLSPPARGGGRRSQVRTCLPGPRSDVLWSSSRFR